MLKHSQLEQDLEILETEVRKKTESLRKEKEEITLKRNPLINDSKKIQNQITTLQEEMDSSKGMMQNIEGEIKANNERL